MLINREPTVIIGGIAEVVRAIIPMLLVFGIIHWTDVQTGAVILVVGVCVGFAEKLFTRSQVVPTETANAQIKTALKASPDTKVSEIVAITKENA